jgi:hypothetical protein
MGTKKDATDQATVSSILNTENQDGKSFWQLSSSVDFLCSSPKLNFQTKLLEFVFWFSKGIIYCTSQETWVYILPVSRPGSLYFFCQQAWFKYFVFQWVWSDVYCMSVGLIKYIVSVSRPDPIYIVGQKAWAYLVSVSRPGPIYTAYQQVWSKCSICQ